jgi:hypothetical protein
MKTDREVQRELAEQAQRDGRCEATKSFTLGDRSTALVTCEQQPDDHQWHYQVEVQPDGSTVTFAWRSS